MAGRNADIKVRFGRRLKDLRLERGLSQEDLALRAGLHRTYVSSAERGERNVSLVNLARLATARQSALRYQTTTVSREWDRILSREF